MTAESTAQAVLGWAVRADGPMPGGDLSALGDLAAPSEETVHKYAVLAAACAARLGTGAPPFGDATPADTGGILLAAALGGQAEATAAERLIELVPSVRVTQAGWSAAVARHAVTMRAVTHPLAERCLAVSPLTRLLHRPTRDALAGDSVETDVALANRLLGLRGGERILWHAWAEPSADADVLTWRATVLSRLVTEEPGRVLDLYVLARLRWGAEWDKVNRTAIRELSRFAGRPAGPLAVLTFWLPLARLDRNRPELLRARPLLSGHRPIIDAIVRLGLIGRG
ncbi:hypothetical protein [Paractinoplanes globisporus]|uniref:FtsH ternary system domain-containing protein n=1 Tax=Paractinoplanes globisporus TaxID=113565 RepID=A0ABW6WBU1_9ACTN|nr:hypothetical protein [Actinoplanes globisporus]